jgi:hypothetical protein
VYVTDTNSVCRIGYNLATDILLATLQTPMTSNDNIYDSGVMVPTLYAFNVPFWPLRDALDSPVWYSPPHSQRVGQAATPVTPVRRVRFRLL